MEVSHVAARTFTVFPGPLRIILCLLASCAPLAAGTEDVIWQKARNTTPSYPTPGNGSTLTKSGGLATWGDADAVSLNRIEGDGSVSFRFGNTSQRVAVGVTLQNPDRGTRSFQYSIIANGDAFDHYLPGTFAWVGDGVEAPGYDFTASDVFTIERIGLRVRFLKNGELVYQSDGYFHSHGSLTIDTSFHDPGASVNSCRITSEPEHDVVWDELVGPIRAGYGAKGGDAGSTLQHSGSLGPQGATGAESLEGDCYVKFRVADGHTLDRVGLVDGNPSLSPGAGFYGIEVVGIEKEVEKGGIGITAYYHVLAEGNIPSAKIPFFGSDVFQVRRVGTRVEVLQNDGIVYTSPTAPSGPTVVTAQFEKAPGVLTGCRYAAARVKQKVVWKPAAGLRVDYVGQKATSRISATTVATRFFYSSSSTKKIVKDGTVSFRVPQTLSAVVALGTYPGLGLEFLSDGQMQLLDPSGSSDGGGLPYAAGDVFEFERAGNQFEIRQNGSVVADKVLDGSLARFATEELPLQIDIGTPGAFAECAITGVPEDVDWRDLVNATAGHEKSQRLLGSVLSKTSLTTGEDSGAVSQQNLFGDGFIEFHAGQTDKTVAVGLSADNRGTTSAIPFAFKLNSGGFRVFRNGVPISPLSPYGVGTVFRIERKQGAITFTAGSYSASLLVSDSPPVFLDTSFAGAAANSINKVSIYDAAAP